MQLPVTGPAEQVPTRAHDHDAGLDLRANQNARVPAGGRVLVGTGIAVAIPPGHVGLVCPRSGMASKFGVTVANAPGVIDAGYRGEVKVNLVNHGRAALDMSKGDRIAQLLVVPVAMPTISHVDDLPAPVDGRGVGGHGSTGA